MESFPAAAPGIRRLTVNLDDTDVGRFEDLWPVPEGVALHAWLVGADRPVLVDPWDAGGYGLEEVAVDLKELGLGWKDLAAVAFTRPPTAAFLEGLAGVAPRLKVLGVPGTTGFDAGSGVVLEPQNGFWTVPSVGAVFTGDAFAGLGWVEEELFFEDLADDGARYFENEWLRWYAARPTAMPTLPTGARLLLPAHGCAFRDPPAALARLQKFEAWGRGDGLDEVTVVWPDGASAGADALVGGALDLGAGLNLYTVPGDDPTALAAGARRASLVVVAEGLDDGFLAGLTKDVWRPKVSTSPADLRAGLVRRWTEGD